MTASGSRAKARQKAMRAARGGRLRRDVIERRSTITHRARFLLSGLMRCGCCGGGYTIIGKDRYGCATRRQKGTCDNGRTITRQQIEARVFDGLKERLLAPDLVAEFVSAVQEERGRAQTRRRPTARSRAQKARPRSSARSPAS